MKIKNETTFKQKLKKIQFFSFLQEFCFLFFLNFFTLFRFLNKARGYSITRGLFENKFVENVICCISFLFFSLSLLFSLSSLHEIIVVIFWWV